MNSRRDFLKRFALGASALVVADLEMLERLTHKRTLFPGWTAPRSPDVFAAPMWELTMVVDANSPVMSLRDSAGQLFTLDQTMGHEIVTMRDARVTRWEDVTDEITRRRSVRVTFVSHSSPEHRILTSSRA